MVLNKAFVLCGGKGVRLYPITYEVQKVMVPINGKPLLEYNLELLKKHGIGEVVLGIGYRGADIKKHFGSHWNGLDIFYSEEKEPLGTGGALKLAEKHFTDTFVMANGDEIKKINITDMYNNHVRNDALATLSLIEVDDTSQYGIVGINGDRILRFVEKPLPGNAPSNLANAGLYILEPGIFSLLPEGKSSVEKDLFSKITETKLYGFISKDQWLTTDTHEKLENTKKLMLHIENK